MKIRRKIDGLEFEFELTANELCDAYDEQQHMFDVSDVECLFEDYYTDDEVLDLYGVTTDTALSLSDGIAWEMRRLMDKYDVDMSYAREEAARTIIMACAYPA